jgi:hypothetical protein
MIKSNKSENLCKITKNTLVFHCCFSQILGELVPTNLLKIQSTSDWKKSISSAFAQNSGKQSNISDMHKYWSTQ